MLCFNVYWQLTIGEDTPETSLVFMNLFYGVKYDENWDSGFKCKANYMFNCTKKFCEYL